MFCLRTQFILSKTLQKCPRTLSQDEKLDTKSVLQSPLSAVENSEPNFFTNHFFDQTRHFILVHSAVDCSTTTGSDRKRENETKTDCRTEPSRDIKETIKLHAADIEGSLPSQLPDMSIKSSTALRKSTKLRLCQLLVLSIFTFLQIILVKDLYLQRHL